MGGVQGEAEVGRDLHVAGAEQGEDHRQRGQEGDDQVPAPQPRARQGLAPRGRGRGRDAGLGRVRPRHAPHQRQARRLRPSRRPPGPPRAAIQGKLIHLPRTVTDMNVKIHATCQWNCGYLG